MSVEELSALHRRYVDLSHRFRANWVFHQFLQSLRKVFDGDVIPNHADAFQDLYARLKQVSQNLTSGQVERTEREIEAVDGELGELASALMEQDSKVPPEELRQFFHRFPRYDEKILVQLSRFLVYAAKRDTWTDDRVDKLDFLLTRAAQRKIEGPDRYILVESQEIRETFASLWALTEADLPLVRVAQEHLDELDDIRRGLQQVESLDGLNDSGLLDRFRELKHELGPLYLEPDLLTAILETNLEFKNLVGRLYRREERRIVTDYQQVFQLEEAVPLDVQLERELADFRRQIERFERRLQQDDFRLGDLARIRSKVQDLMPRLERARGGDYSTPDTAPVGGPPPLAGGGGGADPVLERRVSDELAEILGALEDTDREDSPRAVCLKPEVFPLGLEPREVVAFRRVASEDSAAYDLNLERFLLQGAALRLQLKRMVDEIRDLLDDTARDWEAPVYGRARVSLDLAGEVLAKIEHRVLRLVQDGKGQDARFIEVSRMRMMREYSGLWLLAYKPYLETVPEG